MKVLFFFASMLAVSFLFAQRSYIYGSITDSAMQESLPGAHLKNINAGLATNCDLVGKFRIPAKAGDTLVVSYVGYQDKVHIVRANEFEFPIKLEMTEDLTLLDEIEVNVFPEYVRFKEIILETEPQEDFKIDLPKVVVDYEPPTAQQLQNPELAPSVGFAFNLDGLTKKGKEKKKLEKLLAKRSERNKAYSKFTRSWVGEETKLKGDRLTDFIEYCDFSTKYLAETSLFDIREKMMALLAEFNSEKDDHNPGA